MNNDYEDINETLQYCSCLLRADAEASMQHANKALKESKHWEAEEHLKDAMAINDKDKIIWMLIEKFQKEASNYDSDESSSMFKEDPTKDLDELIESLYQ
jgi:hypothetical protein